MTVTEAMLDVAEMAYRLADVSDAPSVNAEYHRRRIRLQAAIAAAVNASEELAGKHAILATDTDTGLLPCPKCGTSNVPVCHCIRCGHSWSSA